MKKWLVATLLAALLSTGTICPAMAAPHILPARLTLRVNAHIRAEPSAESESKRMVFKGEEVLALEVTDGGGWLRVQYGRFTGYIRGDLLVDTTRGLSPYGAGPALSPEDGLAKIPLGLGFDTTLKAGMRGEKVRRLQEALGVLGYGALAFDGIFGEATRAAVKAFQRAYGLTADGVVGRQTHSALAAALAAVATEQ